MQPDMQTLIFPGVADGYALDSTRPITASSLCLQTTGTGVETRIEKAHKPRHSRGFFASMAAYGRAVWEAARLAGSFSRFSTLHGLAHPVERKSEVQTLKGSTQP
jgi:hypothetical protein